MNVVKGVSKELVKRRHDVVVCTSDFRWSDLKVRVRDVDGVTVRFFRSIDWGVGGSLKFFVTFDLCSFLEREVRFFDVVHLHEYRTFLNIVVHHYAMKYGVPYVLHAHCSLPRIMAKQGLKWIFDVFFGYRLLRDASKVIALSQTEAEQYRGMGVPEEKIEIIPNGIDLTEYATLPPKGSFKKKFNILGDKKMILYLGRIHRNKGIDFLVKAYAYLIKNMKYNNVALVIAGPNDGYLAEAKSLVDSLGLNNEVIFTGFLSEEDKIKAYVDSEMVVNVEPENVFGLVPLEAAACSAPVIVSKTNDISEVVLDGNLGLAVEYNSIGELTEAMIKMLDQSSNVSLVQCQKSRKYIFDNYDWNVVMPQLERIYKLALSDGARAKLKSPMKSLQ